MPKIVDHNARRDEISAVAVSLIAEGGMEAATIREIAQASGYSKGVVEHYFDGKEELISGALKWINVRYEQRVRRATEGLNGLKALLKRLQATCPIDKSSRDEWKVRLVFWSMAAVQEDLCKAQEKRFELAANAFEEDLLIALEVGDLTSRRSAAELARQLLTQVAGMSVIALHSRSVYTRKFIHNEIESMIGQLSDA
ncbi:MAG: TetR/AcrR family transcriptional regulator [Halioglobus sp.]